MTRIVECVPNFSEGRDMGVIDRITAEIRNVPGVMLLDVDPGRETHRTVVTFAGTPEGVEEAAFRAIRTAAELIDMSAHSGAHPRMGATDVCPFVPVSGVTMEECVAIARRLGRRVGEELRIPVYLYEESASSPERRSLAYLREGEYEALPEKLKKKEFKPDFGPVSFHQKSGATVIGAREFLIAYNVNLNARNVRLAREIAGRMREKGFSRKNPETGKKETVAGTLKAVRAVGWYIPEYDRTQISVNLLNYRVTPLHRVFEEAEKFAAESGVRVTGSELVGLIPLEAMRETGRHYLRKQGSSTGVSERELVRVAVQSLGMSEISEFKPEHKIIEYRLREKGELASMAVDAFLDELASDSPAPGGGSVSSLCGALSAALSAMVGNLTFSRKGYEEVREEMGTLAEEAQKLKNFFTEAIDLDTAAFKRVMAFYSLPKKSEEEKEVRDKAILEAMKEATRIPLAVLEKAVRASELALRMVQKGNRNSISDAGVAGLSASAAAEGAYCNVLVNVKEMTDEAFKKEMTEKGRGLLRQVEKTSAEIREIISRELAG